MSLLTDTLKRYISYVTADNQPKQSEEALLALYRKNQAAFKNDFFKTPIDDPQLVPYIKRLLITHVGPDSEYLYGRYINTKLSLFQFLLELNELNEGTIRKKRQLTYFIDRIKEKNKFPWMTLLCFGLLGLTLMTGLTAGIIYAGGLTILQQFVAAAMFFPLCGLVFTSAVAVYSLIQKNSEKNLTFMQRFRENLFLLANAALNIAAYSILISAAATTTPLAAALFIVATVANVIKEAINLFSHPKHQVVVDPTMPLAVRQQLEREHALHEQHKNSLYINLCSALLLSIAISVWCLIPGTLFINVAVIAIIGLIHVATVVSQRVNENRIHQNLIRRFEELERPYREGRDGVEMVVIAEKTNAADETHTPGLRVNVENTNTQTLQQIGLFGQPDKPSQLVVPVFVADGQQLNHAASPSPF